jgi:hypothetical protein
MYRQPVRQTSTSVSNNHYVTKEGRRPFLEKNMKIIFSLLLASAGLLSGCALYVPDAPGTIIVPQGAPQGGPGNGFCPPGQAKKGNC